MNLIPQNKINEAAKYTSSDSAFKLGVQFALNEIQPLMVEFAEFCLGSKYPYNKDGIWTKHEVLMKQLLEEFIKSKDK